MNKKIIWIAALAFLLGACSKEEDQAKQAPAQKPAAQQATPASGSTAKPQVQGGNSANVLNVAQAGGYTYVEVLTQGGDRFWVAGNRTELAPGDKVTWRDGAMMTNFHSKSLGRTFEKILFISKFINAKAAPPANSGKVLSVTAAAGYNYLEVDSAGQKKWLAAPVGVVEVGNTVSWTGGAPMHNFTSKSLKRTFDTILFVGAVNVSN